MIVELIAATSFVKTPNVPWLPAGTDMDVDALAEFAGRACYQSWNRPNPATATNDGYLQHILDVGHLSVLEHGSATFYVTGVSRALTHELVRHRHLSFSQLSQRFVPASYATTRFVPPPVVEDDADMFEVFDEAIDDVMAAYKKLLALLEERFSYVSSSTRRRKLVREAARSLLPNATETRIVVTGNMRAWRHFVELRGTIHADVEIRQLAVELLRQLKNVAPSSFQDLVVVELDDDIVVSKG